jgi:hypothetical protein
MGFFRKIKDTEEDRARARLLAYFEDNPDQVFYSRQLEVLFEREYFHWVTNRALRRLVDRGGPMSATMIPTMRRPRHPKLISMVW